MCTLTRLTILRAVRVIAIFGPTGVGKTEVAIALAERLRAEGEDPVASPPTPCRSTTGWRSSPARRRPRSRRGSSTGCVGFVPVTSRSAPGRTRALAHAEIDAAIAAGRRPIVVGGTGLYLRAALAELDLRPPAARGRARGGRRS